eukprot:g28579.t1
MAQPPASPWSWTRLLLVIGGGGSSNKDILLVFGQRRQRTFQDGGTSKATSRRRVARAGLLVRQWQQPGLAKEPGTLGCSRPRAGTPGIIEATAERGTPGYRHGSGGSSWVRKARSRGLLVA